MIAGRINTEEAGHALQTHHAMLLEGSVMKTIAIRLEDDLHAELQAIAQLMGSTITDEIRTAIVTHIEVSKGNPKFTEAAQALLEEIEREASERRTAVNRLLGQQDVNPARPGLSRRSKEQKGGDTEEHPA